MSNFRTVSVDDLRPGMYIHDLRCRWLDHPFPFNSFTVKDEATLRKIRETGIREVVIDVAKSRIADIEPRQIPELQEEAPISEVPATAPLAEEMGRARLVHREANRLIAAIMEDARLGRQVDVEQVNPVVERMMDSIFRNKNALLTLGTIRSSDLYTFQHSVNVGVLLMAFAKDIGLDRESILEIGLGGILHDVGKIRVPAEILNKPGRLTDEEVRIMRMHVVYSREILSGTEGIPQAAIDVAGMHHERYDGTGYPEGLRGDEISKAGQMASVVDVYDAISSDRCYHKGKPPSRVLGQLLEWSRAHFDLPIVHQFIRCVGVFPPGTLVRLDSGLLGVVLEGNAQDTLLPRLNVFFDSKRRAYIAPFELDLANPPRQYAGTRIAACEDPQVWGIRCEDFLV